MQQSQYGVAHTDELLHGHVAVVHLVLNRGLDTITHVLVHLWVVAAHGVQIDHGRFI